MFPDDYDFGAMDNAIDEYYSKEKNIGKVPARRDGPLGRFLYKLNNDIEQKHDGKYPRYLLKSGYVEKWVRLRVIGPDCKPNTSGPGPMHNPLAHHVHAVAYPPPQIPGTHENAPANTSVFSQPGYSPSGRHL
ncbi:hypothetical protein [Streptomyces sp. Inha503]|uniref:hypothetical protein n=1 Tax=Streptomyces sp. Inha503 TaxID=3383314 RepID=UPI0039A13CC1